MASKARSLGYLMIDERACAGGVLTEIPTATCCHCNRTVILRPDRTRERGWCRRCDAYTCDRAGCQVNCIPMQKVIDLVQHHPNEPYLLYGPNNEPLVSPKVLDSTKIY